MKQGAKGIWLVLRTAVRVSPWQSLLCLVEAFGRVLAALRPLFLGIFAAGAIEQDLSRMLWAVLALVGSSAGNMLLQTIGINARIYQMERIGFAFDEQVAALTAQIPTLDHLENSDYLDQLQILRDNENAIGQALNSIIMIVNDFAFAISILLVTVTADWRLLILAVLGIPRLLGARWASRWDKAAEKKAATPSRLSRHLIDLSTDVAAGSEARVFGLQSELRRRVQASTAARRRPAVDVARKRSLLNAANAILFFGAAVAILAWITSDVLRGTVPIPALVVAVGIVQGLEQVSGTFANAVTALGWTGRNCARFLWLQDYAAEAAARHPGRTTPPPELRAGIRVENLSYRYGQAEQDSLSDITLDLPAGSIVALVGENGAGKSTLVKLLAGLYDPTAGRVLVDNEDLADLDLTAWRSRMSGAFQDHATFELTAQQAVGVGEIGQVEDEARVHAALRAGAAEDVVNSLPQGLSTQLGTTWPDGVDLSGGQWQRLAIGRGMMRQTPLLLILDEPTSALDAATEHNLFERYAEAARAAGGRGAVTLLVTHRFSTVAAADLVVVLDQGRVVEHGPHRELVAAGGHYAELYELQARGYR